MSILYIWCWFCWLPLTRPLEIAIVAIPIRVVAIKWTAVLKRENEECTVQVCVSTCGGGADDDESNQHLVNSEIIDYSTTINRQLYNSSQVQKQNTANRQQQ